jgi:hypothetical protein
MGLGPFADMTKEDFISQKLGTNNFGADSGKPFDCMQC